MGRTPGAYDSNKEDTWKAGPHTSAGEETEPPFVLVLLMAGAV